MKELVDALCSDECAGRAPGTAGGIEARRLVIQALREAGLSAREQEIAAGANVIATMPGETDRWVMVAAHYDHLGTEGGDIYRGADDNAAGVAILVEVARGLAKEKLRRGLIIAAFDAEEPPHFLEPTMGSREWIRQPTVPLEKLDMMICMDVVGHALGPPGTPDDVRQTLLALGAERSVGTAAQVDRLSRAEPGVVVRRADAEIIPPLSDYEAFWRKEIPFMLLSCARGRYYHTPQDTPVNLDWAKIQATARWLERFVRETCERPEQRIAWRRGVRDDASTLRTIAEITGLVATLIPLAAEGEAIARSLLAACGPDGRLPEPKHGQLEMLTDMLEQGLA
jgi:Zn-dependent M28 family amino/carboxypeptidase